jgi:CTP synthase
MGVQFHPEFRSRPNRPHPIFREFIAAAIDRLPEGAQRELPLDEKDDRMLAEATLARSGAAAVT